MMLELAACLQTLETRRSDVVSTIDRAIQRAIDELKAIAPLFDAAPASVDEKRLDVTLGGKPLPRGTAVKISTTTRYPRHARSTKAKPAARKATGKAIPAKPNGKLAATPIGRAKGAYDVGAAIISALGAAREALSPKDVIRLTKLPRWRVMRTLLDMHASGQLTKIGSHRGAKYAIALVPGKPRPGAVAGTQAAPPVGPSPANGTKASGDFEVAWNGTKERNGQAPSILPPRGRLT